MVLTLFHDEFFAALRAARSHEEAGEYRLAADVLGSALFIAPTVMDGVQVARRLDRLKPFLR